MQNKDGSYGSRATQKDLAECYGADVLNMLSYVAEVHPDRWNWYLSLIEQQATIAAHHGRKSIKWRIK